MTELCQFNVHAPKWQLAYFVPINCHFGQIFCDMGFTFVLPIIYINFDIQTNFEVNPSQLDPNWPFYLKQSLNAQASFTKKLLLLYFSMNLFETFRIDVNMDFENAN